ncbi:hypothetical protein Pelo_10733 [Pelomyxa schiedti]|nr:hypothetical protein Pelo_10733 [Pelomyxa schiedti]
MPVRGRQQRRRGGGGGGSTGGAPSASRRNKHKAIVRAIRATTTSAQQQQQQQQRRRASQQQQQSQQQQRAQQEGRRQAAGGAAITQRQVQQGRREGDYDEGEGGDGDDESGEDPEGDSQEEDEDEDADPDGDGDEDEDGEGEEEDEDEEEGEEGDGGGSSGGSGDLLSDEEEEEAGAAGGEDGAGQYGGGRGACSDADAGGGGGGESDYESKYYVEEDDDYNEAEEEAEPEAETGSGGAAGCGADGEGDGDGTPSPKDDGTVADGHCGGGSSQQEDCGNTSSSSPSTSAHEKCRSNDNPSGVLLFEYLPWVHYNPPSLANSSASISESAGVLLVIYTTGHVFFQPLTEKTKLLQPVCERSVVVDDIATSPVPSNLVSLATNAVVMTPQSVAHSEQVTQLPNGTLRTSTPPKDTTGSSTVETTCADNAQKPVSPSIVNDPLSKSFLSPQATSANAPTANTITRHVIKDITLPHTSMLHVATFTFEQIKPRKLLLSPCKRLLLILGYMRHNRSELVVFKIHTSPAPYFEIIFRDLSLSYRDQDLLLLLLALITGSTLAMALERDTLGTYILSHEKLDLFFVLDLSTTCGVHLCVTDSIDPTDILCVKWTHTLLIGSIVSGAIIVKGKGMSELVDNCYSSAFLSLDNDFTQTAVNFTQYGRYYRFWTDIAGNVRVLLVTQQTPTIHPEWRDLTRCRADLVKLRLLASRVGYFINDISMGQSVYMMLSYSKKRTDATYMKLKLPNYLTDSAPQAQPAKTKHPASVQNTSSATKTATTTPSTTSTTTICATSKTSGTNLWSGGKELASAVIGLHLHRCHQCRVVLGKPLRCGGCMAATYCSKVDYLS